jgi:hypothetical protein
MAMFELGGALAAGRALGTGRMRHAALAGLLAGFAAASKYLGLLFVPCCALPLLFHRRWFFFGLAFGIAALAAGFQWYGWNALHSGDPFFPILFRALHLPDSDIWTAAHDAFFRREFFSVENPEPANLFWFFAYPFEATLRPLTAFESGRTGLGPFWLVALPFAALGAWRYRHDLRASPLAAAGLVAFAFYAAWFFTGSSQRVRHLLPVYPILVLCFMVAAAWWATRRRAAAPLAAGIALVALLQLGGQAAFAANYVRHVLSGESREAMLERTVPMYAIARWVNTHLDRNDRVLVTFRQLVYPIDIPVFYAHHLVTTQINIDPLANDPRKFWSQLLSQGVTHLIVTVHAAPAGGADERTTYERFADALLAEGCARSIARLDGEAFPSRTFSSQGRNKVPIEILEIVKGGCRL